MGLFHNLLRCVPTYTNHSQDNKCEIAEHLDIGFGAVLVISVVLSTLLNPLMVILKIKEKNLIGRIYASLGAVYFMSNVERGPTIIRKLFNKEYEEQIAAIPNTHQIVAYVTMAITVQNQQFILLLISSTRFVKCYKPFRRISGKAVIASAIFFNISTAALTFSKWFQRERMVFLSVAQSVTLEPSRGNTSVTNVVHIILSLTMSLLSLICSLGAIRVIQTAPNLTEQSRAKKRKASIVVGLMSLFDLLFGVLNMMTVLAVVSRGPRYIMVVVIFSHTVVSYSVTAGFNPLLILMAGYSLREIRCKLAIRNARVPSQAERSSQMQSSRT